MQTMPPTDNAVTYHSPPVQPTIRKMRHVSSSVATVIPEIGFDDEPTSPVSCDDTATNKNPKTTIMIAPRKFICSGDEIMIATMMAAIPMNTVFIGMSE